MNMDFLGLVNKRQSVRSYDSRPVDPDILKNCLEAARLAPSACNSQPWKFIVVTDPRLKNSIADAASSEFIPMNHFTKQAPVLIVLVRESGNLTSKMGGIIKNKTYTLIDIGIAAEHFCLQAASVGLGTCMMGWFDEKKVRKTLNIPFQKRVELIITVGYPKTEEIREKKRKELEEIVSYNRYE